MVKNTFTNYIYFFLVVMIIFLLPGILHANLPAPLGLTGILAALLPFVLLLLPLTVIFVPAMIKVWLLKGKLSVPWKYKPIEKLSLGALAETVVEFVFLNLIMWFQPAVYEVLNIDAAAAPKNINILLHVAIVIPWYCIMGTISMTIFINFLTTLDKKELRRQYLKTSALLSLIMPVVVIIIIAIKILFFKATP